MPANYPSVHAGRWPGAAPPDLRAGFSEPKPKADWLAMVVLYTPIISVTIISKFAFVMGGTELLISIPLIIGSTLLGCVTGRLKPHSSRMLLYLGMVAVLSLEQVVNERTFSPSSLFLLIALHAAYGFKLEHGGDTSVHQERFQNLCAFIAMCGIAQYFSQFAIGSFYAFPIEHLLPGSIITKNYNAVIPLTYGATTYKANGIFMLEPSYFSQLLATGFTAEICNRRRLSRLALFCCGFGVAFSGTGLIMMAVSLPVLAIVQKRYSIVVFAVVVVFLVYVGGEFVGLELLAKRATEFKDTGSSGYMRYVGPYLALDQYLWSVPSWQRWLFGVGSGMMMKMTPAPLYHTGETGWAKIMIEFGIVGTIAYFGFLYSCVFSSRQPLALRFNLATMSLLSGILDGPAHAMILSLLMWPMVQGDAPAVTREPHTPPSTPPSRRLSGSNPRHVTARLRDFPR